MFRGSHFSRTQTTASLYAGSRRTCREANTPQGSQVGLGQVPSTKVSLSVEQADRCKRPPVSKITRHNAGKSEQSSASPVGPRYVSRLVGLVAAMVLTQTGWNGGKRTSGEALSDHGRQTKAAQQQQRYRQKNRRNRGFSPKRIVDRNYVARITR